MRVGLLNLLFITFFALSTSVAQDNKPKSDALNRQAITLLRTNSDSVILLATQARKLALDDGYLWGVGSSEAILGRLAIIEKNLVQGHQHYSRALAYFKKSDTTEYYSTFNAFNNLGYIFGQYKDYERSIPYYDSAFAALQSIPESAPENVLKAKAKYLIDIPYFKARHLKDAGRLNEAGEILVDLWENSWRARDTLRLTKVLNQIGIVKKRLGEYDEARKYYSMVTSDMVKLSTKAIANHNMGSVYLAEGNLERAEHFYQIAQDQKEQVGKKSSMFVTMLDLGEVQFKKGDYQAAIDQWNEALQTYSAIENNPSYYIIYDWLERAYKRIDLNKSDEYGLLYSEVNKNYLAKQAEIRTQETKNSFNSLIDNKWDKLEREAHVREFIKTYWILCIPVTVLLVWLVYLGVKNYRLKRSQKKLIKGTDQFFEEIKGQI